MEMSVLLALSPCSSKLVTVAHQLERLVWSLAGAQTFVSLMRIGVTSKAARVPTTHPCTGFWHVLMELGLLCEESLVHTVARLSLLSSPSPGALVRLWAWKVPAGHPVYSWSFQ